MGWTVRLTERARRDLGRLDPQVARRVLSFFRDRIEGVPDPRSSGRAFPGSRLGEFWRHRVGDWRAVCALDDKRSTVFVLTVGHRSDAYR